MDIKNKVNSLTKSSFARAVLSAIIGFLVGSSDLGCIRIGNDTDMGKNKNHNWLEINCDHGETGSEVGMTTGEVDNG